MKVSARIFAEVIIINANIQIREFPIYLPLPLKRCARNFVGNRQRRVIIINTAATIIIVVVVIITLFPSEQPNLVRPFYELWSR